MKVATNTLIVSETAVERSVVSDWVELFKARLTSLVLITTLVGFYLGTVGALDIPVLISTLLGTALLAAGAAALNQVLEAEYDARMDRTADRPIPAGRISPTTALMVGVAISILGLAILTVRVNTLTGFLGMLTLASYVFIYTPLKRYTTLNTLVGAIPGALPPLMGWTSATQELGRGGWALFTILFFWQLPHFMAIAWMYRDDYARAGYRMLPVIDPAGRRTAATAIRHTVALVGFSLALFILGLVGKFYLFGALTLGMAFLAASIRFAIRLNHSTARQLFFASIIYLPLLLGLIVFDKVR